MTIPLTLDASGRIFREFRVNDVPTILIADAAGRVTQRLEGSKPGMRPRCARHSDFKDGTRAGAAGGGSLRQKG